METNEIMPGLKVQYKGEGSGFLGTVDHMDGEQYIKLRRSDSPDQKHHWIPLDWAEKVEGANLLLNKTEQECETGILNSRPHAA